MTPAKGTPMSIATKVVIQINCKLGGAAWMVNYPMKGVMTVGFDIATDTRNKSICYGAFVASMDLQETVKVSCDRDGFSQERNNISVSITARSLLTRTRWRCRRTSRVNSKERWMPSEPNTVHSPSESFSTGTASVSFCPTEAVLCISSPDSIIFQVMVRLSTCTQVRSSD